MSRDYRTVLVKTQAFFYADGGFFSTSAVQTSADLPLIDTFTPGAPFLPYIFYEMGFACCRAYQPITADLSIDLPLRQRCFLKPLDLSVFTCAQRVVQHIKSIAL
jgi:hypothetical protein